MSWDKVLCSDMACMLPARNPVARHVPGHSHSHFSKGKWCRKKRLNPFVHMHCSSDWNQSSSHWIPSVEFQSPHGGFRGSTRYNLDLQPLQFLLSISKRVAKTSVFREKSHQWSAWKISSPQLYVDCSASPAERTEWQKMVKWLWKTRRTRHAETNELHWKHWNHLSGYHCTNYLEDMHDASFLATSQTLLNVFPLKPNGILLTK